MILSEYVFFLKKINNQFWEVIVFLTKNTNSIGREQETQILHEKINVLFVC